MNESDIPVYVIRPPGSLICRRYDWDGTFVSDDGRPGLAFFTVGGQGPPYVYGVDPRPEVAWSWGTPSADRRRTVWHYQLRPGFTDLLERPAWRSDSQHPNHVAFEAAMRECSRQRGCANGRAFRFDLTRSYDRPERSAFDDWRGRVWEVSEPGLILFNVLETSAVEPPEKPVCFRCAGDGFAHKLVELAEERRDLLGAVAANAEELVRRRAKLEAVEEDLAWAEDRLRAFRELVS